MDSYGRERSSRLLVSEAADNMINLKASFREDATFTGLIVKEGWGRKNKSAALPVKSLNEMYYNHTEIFINEGYAVLMLGNRQNFCI